LRFILVFGGSTLVTAATPFLVKWLGQGNERLGWQLTMAFWGLAASGLFLVTFFNTRERIAPPPTQKTNVRQDVKDLTRNGPWMVLFFLALIIMITITLRTSTAAYYLKYYVKRPELLAAFVPAYMAAATFSQKLGTALAAVVMGWVLTSLGYVANATQTPESQTGIVLLISLIPAVFAFLAVAVMLFYRLDNRTLRQIQVDLAARKGTAAARDASTVSSPLRRSGDASHEGGKPC
jgi:Na+/melibiose symporter-like transporter